MKGKKKSIRGDEWIEEQGLILFRGKVYVLRDEELRKEIMHLHHKYVLSYVDGCDVHMSEGESLSRDACREAYAEPNSKHALDGYFCGFYYGIT